jgi:hypothetical protein
MNKDLKKWQVALGLCIPALIFWFCLSYEIGLDQTVGFLLVNAIIAIAVYPVLRDARSTWR